MVDYQVLIVEDDYSVRDLIETALDIQGYRCAIARNGTAALSLLSVQGADVVLLDLGLPDIDGVEIIKNVRTWSSVPIIVISARTAGDEKIAALDAGADDYLTKPFSIDELLARLRGTFRRLEYLKSLKNVSSSMLKNGNLSIDLDARSVEVDGRPVHLTPTEYRLLVVLASNAGRVLTYSTILKNIWGSPLESDIASLRVTVTSLRRKIEADRRSPVYVQTNVGVGYGMPRVD